MAAINYACNGTTENESLSSQRTTDLKNELRVDSVTVNRYNSSGYSTVELHGLPGESVAEAAQPATDQYPDLTSIVLVAVISDGPLKRLNVEGAAANAAL